MTKRKKTAAPPADTGKKKFLHVACGPADPRKIPVPFRGPEWQEVRVDGNPRVQPDIVSGMDHMPKVMDDSMDAVWCAHGLARILPHRVSVVLAEFRRVIKEGGLLSLSVPDLQRIGSHMGQGAIDKPVLHMGNLPVSALDLVYGHHKALERDPSQAYHTGFSADVLGPLLRAAGFCKIQIRKEKFDLFAIATKLPKEHGDCHHRITLIDPQRASGPNLSPTGSILPDELDQAPQIWKPLGLKS